MGKGSKAKAKGSRAKDESAAPKDPGVSTGASPGNVRELKNIAERDGKIQAFMRVDADGERPQTLDRKTHKAVMRDQVGIGDFSHRLDRRRMHWRCKVVHRKRFSLCQRPRHLRQPDWQEPGRSVPACESLCSYDRC